MQERYCTACGFLLEKGRPLRTCPICRAARALIGLGKK